MSGPEAIVAASADAWGRLDADAVAELFTADATYVSVLSGPVADLRRAFAVAARTWRTCRVDDLRLATGDPEEGGMAVVGATYTFSGVTRTGREITYAATATFRLRDQGGRWRICAFEESAPDPGPAAG